MYISSDFNEIDIRFYQRSISHGPDLIKSNKYDKDLINNVWADKSDIQNNNVRQRKNHNRNRSASFGGRFTDFSEAASRVVGQAEEMMVNMIHRGCNVVHIHNLPGWLKYNDYLLWGHRPQLNSFKECFSSIFRIHTETVNIWTHLLDLGHLKDAFRTEDIMNVYPIVKQLNPQASDAYRLFRSGQTHISMDSNLKTKMAVQMIGLQWTGQGFRRNSSI